MSPLSDGFLSGGISNYVRGWRFPANAAVTVTELGAFTPHSAGQGYSINLWDFGTASLLGQVNISSNGLNAWEWVNLATPVNLLSGSQYIVSIYSASSPYYFRSVSGLPLWMPTGTIQYLDMRYANSATVGTFPTSVLAQYQYGVPDIGYRPTVPSSVPEPSSLAMFALVGAGLVVIRRKRA